MDERNSMFERQESRIAVERLRQRIAVLRMRSGEKFEEMREVQQRMEKLGADLAKARANNNGGLNKAQGQPGKHGQSE
jgi:hypothetical protein